MRLIDADKLIIKLYEEQPGDWEFFRHMVINTSTVDAVPIMHGQWLNGMSGNYKICSECKQIADFDYCPNCGARMDGCNNDREAR